MYTVSKHVVTILLVTLLIHSSEPYSTYRNSESWWGSIPEEEHVVKLTGTTKFDTRIAAGPTVVMFYAEYCRYSRTPRGPFAAAAAQLSRDGSQVVFGAVDCKKADEICDRYDEIVGFPTFLYFLNGRVVDSFDEDRTKANFISWVTTTRVSGKPGFNQHDEDDDDDDDDDDEDDSESEELPSVVSTEEQQMFETPRTTVAPESREEEESTEPNLISVDQSPRDDDADAGGLKKVLSKLLATQPKTNALVKYLSWLAKKLRSIE